jgi:hypothetical protein
MTPGWYSHQTKPFTRRWWSQTLRTLAWVSVVTVLIWIYADMEFTREREFRVVIRLTVGGSENLVILPDRRPPQFEIVFKAAGASTGLDRFEHRLKSRTGPLEYDLSGSSPGLATLSTEDVLSRLTEPRKDGLALSAVTPTTMSVRLDERITVTDVPVELVYTGGELAAEPIKTPQTVTIRVARSLWETLGGKAVVKTVPVNLQKIDRSREIVAEIAPMIGEVPVTPDPAEVRVKVQVRELTQEQTIKTAVQVSSPPAWIEDGTWRRYTLVRKDPAEWAQVELVLSGPREELSRLRPEQIEAYVMLNDGDKKPVGSWLTREVSVRLPEGSQLKLVGERPKLAFRLDPVATPP